MGRRLPAIPVAEVVVVRHPFAGMNEVSKQGPQCLLMLRAFLFLNGKDTGFKRGIMLPELTGKFLR